MNHATLAKSPNASINSSDLRDNRRFAYPVAAYRRGYEDSIYEKTYCDIYCGDGGESAASRQYQRGFGDGRKAKGEGR